MNIKEQPKLKYPVILSHEFLLNPKEELKVFVNETISDIEDGTKKEKTEDGTLPLFNMKRTCHVGACGTKKDENPASINNIINRGFLKKIWGEYIDSTE